MPLPLIPAAAALIAGGTALHGARKGLEAKHDMDEAKVINSTSEDYAREAEEFISMAKEKTSQAISDLGREKIDILSSSIREFVEYFEKIKHMELKNGPGIEELQKFNPSSEEFRQLKTASFGAREAAVNGVAAVGSGVLLAYGTYSAVMGGAGGLLVTATTGTALSSLTGAAAANATLAWLGGGALSAGGLGMAGGTMVLGGLVVGPALAVGGSIFASQAKSALNNAYSNYDKARAFRRQAKNVGIALKGICVRAEQLTGLLQELNSYFVSSVKALKHIVKNAGTDWRNYSETQKKSIYQCVQLAQTIKVILDTSLLREDGTLNEVTESVLTNGNQYLQMLSCL